MGMALILKLIVKKTLHQSCFHTLNAVLSIVHCINQIDCFSYTVRLYLWAYCTSSKTFEIRLAQLATVIILHKIIVVLLPIYQKACLKMHYLHTSHASCGVTVQNCVFGLHLVWVGAHNRTLNILTCLKENKK